MLDRLPSLRPDISAFARKLGTVLPLDAGRIATLNALPGRRRRYDRGEVLARPGDRLSSPQLIVSGWVHRAIYLGDGGRQIIGIGIPGDFLGGRAGAQFAFYTASAAMPTEMFVIERGALEALAARDAALAGALDWSADREFVNFARKLERLGRQRARTRVAHFLLDLYWRHRLIGDAENGVLALPMRQRDIADACGLSLVHVNKTIAFYGEAGLLRMHRGRLDLLDLPRLCKLTDLGFESFLAGH